MTNKASVTGKEPWLAVILSNIFPGVGQIYAGQLVRGLILIFVALSLLGLGAWSIIHPAGNTLIGFQLVIAYFLLLIFNLFDAHRCTRKGNDREFENLRKSDKDPWLAVFLSRIFPGLGQAYQGQWLPAIGFSVSALLIALLSGVFPLLAVAYIGLYFSCLYHAYVSSPTNRVKSETLILGVCLALLLLQLLPISVRGAFESRYIPSGAMEPTLQIGDRFFVNKLAYQFTSPQRGDVVVFRATPTLQQQNFKDAFVKRVIGLPGNKVEVKAGLVYINDQPLHENYIADKPEYTYGPTIVPKESYFMLGDNRNNSYDSHYWGFVLREYIIGKATKRYWPPNRAFAIQ